MSHPPTTQRVWQRSWRQWTWGGKHLRWGATPPRRPGIRSNAAIKKTCTASTSSVRQHYRTHRVEIAIAGHLVREYRTMKASIPRTRRGMHSHSSGEMTPIESEGIAGLAQESPHCLRIDCDASPRCLESTRLLFLTGGVTSDAADHGWWWIACNQKLADLRSSRKGRSWAASGINRR